jgi:hypothetical protein
MPAIAQISTEPEAIDKNVDPFVGMEITSDTEGIDHQNDGQPDTAGSKGNGRSHIVTEDHLAHPVSLDRFVVDSECEDTDSTEYEDIDPEDEDGSPNGSGGKELVEHNRRLTIKLGVVPPQPTGSTRGQRPMPYDAGCIWTEDDWSCSYDAVFMVFWSLYEQSPSRWRKDWVELSPEWNVSLGNNFNHLIILTDTPVDVRDRAKWFSRYRDRFRDQLSRNDPKSFPRRGHSQPQPVVS